MNGILANFVGGFIAMSIIEKALELNSVTTAGGAVAIGLVAASFDAAMHLCHPLFGV